MDSTAKNRFASELGREIETKRINRGYDTRTSFVEVQALKDSLTHEGLRKIEKGERVPQKDTLRRICKALNVSKQDSLKLEKMALQAEVERDAKKRFGKNVDVELRLDGVAVRSQGLPPSSLVERRAREIVNGLGELVWMYGLLPEDLEHFRRNARQIVLKTLS